MKIMKMTGLKRRIAGIILMIISTAWLAGCSAKTADPVSRSSFLLNTFVTVTLYDSQDEEILDGCIELCSEYEKRLSKTLEESEIYRLNHRKPGERTFTVSEPAARVLEKGLEYSRISDGAFDITIEPLSSLWNFTGEDPQIPSEEEIGELVKRVDYRKVSLEGTQVTFADDVTTIDLGAIAKGFIADELKAYLKEQGVKSAIINLGGNVLAIGGKPDGSSFNIGIQEPFHADGEPITSVYLKDQSVVTSGTYQRYFEKDGILYHHILNPSTGSPCNNGLSSVTIITDSSLTADALSTTCFLLGPEEGMKLVNQLDNVDAIFISTDNEITYSRNFLK